MKRFSPAVGAAAKEASAPSTVLRGQSVSALAPYFGVSYRRAVCFIPDRLVCPREFMRVSLWVAQQSEVPLVPRAMARAALIEPVQATSTFAVCARSATKAVGLAAHARVITSAA